MEYKKIILIFGFLFFAYVHLVAAEVEEIKPPLIVKAASSESDQQIGDFSLSGFGDKGKKSWDLAGKSADIFTEEVKLKDVDGNLYGKDENVNLTAKQGDFNKKDGKVHLEKDVVITTSGGARLTTDSMDSVLALVSD